MAIEYKVHTKMFAPGGPGRVLTIGVQGDTQSISDDVSVRDLKMPAQRDFLNQYCDMAIHVGDVTQDATDVVQFSRAKEYWSDGLRIPYLVCPGNWDMGTSNTANVTDVQIPHYTRFLHDEGWGRMELTNSATNAAAGDTVTLGSTVYTFRTSLSAANDVLIGSDSQGSLANLAEAINADPSGSGTNYHASTVVNPDAYADMVWRTDVVKIHVYGKKGKAGTVAVGASSSNMLWIELGLTSSAPLSGTAGHGGVMERDWFVEYDGSFRRWAIAFERQGVKWLGISVPFGPTTADMAWADALSKQSKYVGHWVIFLTHSIIHREESTGRMPTEFLQVFDTHAPDDGNYWPKMVGYPGATTASAYRTETQTGQELWTTYLSTWRNLKFCFNGHHFSSSTFPQGYRKETGANSQQVHFVHCDYQGGAKTLDTMRLVRMVEASGHIEIRSYSPYDDEFRRGMWEDFRIADAEMWTPPT